VFAAAPELCELLRAVEADYARFLQHRRPEGPYAEVLPFLAEQAQEWEAAAAATSASVPPVVSFPPFSCIHACIMGRSGPMRLDSGRCFACAFCHGTGSELTGDLPGW
jgi:hypothetical protein